jgi:hypothetical protein
MTAVVQRRDDRFGELLQVVLLAALIAAIVFYLVTRH